MIYNEVTRQMKLVIVRLKIDAGIQKVTVVNSCHSVHITQSVGSFKTKILATSYKLPLKNIFTETTLIHMQRQNVIQT